MAEIVQGHTRVLIEMTQPNGSVLSYDFYQINVTDSDLKIREIYPEIHDSYALAPQTPEYEIDIEISGKLIPKSEYPTKLYEVKSHGGSKV